MIRTETEYQKAQFKLKEEKAFIEKQIRAYKDKGLSEKEIQRATDPVISFHEQLMEEVETYERMRRGDLESLKDFNKIGRWLIGARIARNWTQKKLAKEIGVPESQISRDERNEYHGISVERAQKILSALNVHFKAEIEEPIIEDSGEYEIA